MRRPIACLGGMVLSLIMAIPCVGCEGRAAMPSGTDSLNLPPPPPGSGQLAMLISRGWPPHSVLAVVTPEGSREFSVGRLSAVRWRSQQEIIVEQSGSGWSQKLLRIDRKGKTVGTITEEYFVGPQPSPDGRRIAVGHVLDDGGLTRLEIRDLAGGFRLLSAFPPDALPRPRLAAWDPTGTQLAVAIEALEDNGFQGRLAIVSAGNNTVRRLYDRPVDRRKDPRGVMLMFWHSTGIYAWSARGVLRCDPSGADCVALYDPGDARHIIGGTAVGDQGALFLVADVRADPLEPRAKEIHYLNLDTGVGKMWVRLPKGLFVSDIDWIGEPQVGAPNEPQPISPD